MTVTGPVDSDCMALYDKISVGRRRAPNVRFATNRTNSVFSSVSSFGVSEITQIFQRLKKNLISRRCLSNFTP